jgi:hypothetical protein
MRSIEHELVQALGVEYHLRSDSDNVIDPTYVKPTPHNTP